MTRSALFVILATTSSLCATTLETTVTADTYLRNDSGPGTNWNSDADAGGEFLVGGNGAINNLRGLLRFDVSSIVDDVNFTGGGDFANLTINSVTLTLYEARDISVGGDAASVNIRVNDYGYSFVETAATWNDPDGVAGGEATAGGTIGTLLGSQVIGWNSNPSANSNESATVTLDAASFRNSVAAHLGKAVNFILDSDTAAGSALSFQSNLPASTARDAKLTIDYTVTAPGAPTLAVAPGSPAANYTFPLSPVAASPLTRTMRFRNAGATGSITVQAVTVTNTGGAAFSLGAVSQALPATLAPGTTIDIPVTAASAAGGSFTGSLFVDTDLAGQDKNLPLAASFFAPVTQSGSLAISGIYPHLALTHASTTELGISAVVPWAGKLWAIEYFAAEGNVDGSPHLFSIEDNLTLTKHGLYYGGSIASRLIHQNKLILGPYIIDSLGGIREWRVYPDMGGKHVSAIATDLTDPNKLNVSGLSNERWQIDISGTGTPLPASQVVQQYNLNTITSPKYGFTGWHGKGARTGQGVTVYGSNGDGVWPGGAGSLCEWTGVETGNVTNDLAQWKLIERIQINEVTGPGGIRGEVTPNEPIWATGWDHRSVVLMCRDAVTGWHKYRFPKGSHTQDSYSGYHVEWPRIRDVGLPSGKYLMNQHGIMYEFPAHFSPGNTGGIRPLASFHKMIVDYADWNGRIIMGCNDVSSFNNALYGRVNSNFMFLEKSALPSYGERPEGIGSVWYQENVLANPPAQSPTDLVAPTRNPSDPMLVGGFSRRVLHLSHTTASPVTFTLQIDATGNGTWTDHQTITVPANSYTYRVLPETLNASWARLATTTDANNVSATFYLSNPRRSPDSALTAGLAPAAFTGARSDGFVRSAPSADYTTPLELEFAANIIGSGNTVTTTGYYRVDQNLNITPVANPTAESALRSAAAASQDYQVDAASVLINDATYGRVRLPKGSSAYDTAGPTGWFRGRREVVTERQIMNIHGTFYELPRSEASAGGIRRIRPITTHNKLIHDFCSWRGMLVLSGLPASATNNGHVRVSSDGNAALWFGNIDDLWNFGQPSGVGGPWKDTAVTANTASDPYLMRGYEKKILEMSHTSGSPVQFKVEVDILGNNTWKTYDTFTVQPGTTFTHTFPDGYAAYWVRVSSNTATTATAQFTYSPGYTIDAFLDWAHDHGIPTAGGRAPIANLDSDGDGLGNLIEFLTNGNPAASDPNPIVFANGEALITLRNLGAGDATLANLEFSTTLQGGSWAARPGDVVPAASQAGVPAGFTRYKVITHPEENRLFMRLKAQ